MMEAFVMRIWRRIFRPFDYYAELERAIGSSKTVLDVGCGYPSPIRGFSKKFHSVGVDVYEPSIEQSRAEGIHNEYLQADVLEIGSKLGEKSFDCVLASDLIEHLAKEDGLKLLEMLEKIARERVIVFTPNGFLPQGEFRGNPWQAHKSGWTPEEMRKRGYKIIGINGYKPFRGEFGMIRYKPSFLWEIVSDVTQLFLKRFPKATFQMLCVKDMRGMRAAGKTAGIAILLLAVLSAVAAACGQAQGASGTGSGVTDLRVTGRVMLPGVTRLGVNLGDQNYYDSGQMLKNLLYRNPGFESLAYRSILRCAYGGPSRCVDTRQGIQYPAQFWDGASYEVLDGAAAGRRGTVSGSGPAAGGYGLILEANSGSGMRPIGSGDWVAVQKQFAGDPASGWWPTVRGGARLEAERVDLPPGTQGHQALRMEAAAADELAQVNSYFDSSEGMTFVHLRGRYRLSFRAKGVGGTAVLHVHVGRLAPGLRRYLDEDVRLTPAWAEYHEEFTANEVGVPPAAVESGFSVSGGTVLLDDVDLEQTGGDPSNHTVFRDEVLETLKEMRPGVLRMMASYAGLGSTVDNLLAAPMARLRSGYKTWYGATEDIPVGIPEFLELCQEVGAEPWMVVPTAMSLEEARKLAEYLAGGPETAGGALRAAGGRREPWTRAFRTIHIELGNETWNAIFQGETIEDPGAYGRRANADFAAIRAAAGADAGRFDLVVGTQAVYAGRNGAILNAAPLANSLAIAPYLMLGITQWANDGELYGPLLAQPEEMSREGIVEAAAASARGRQLAVYEVNLHTTGGTAPQAVLDRFTPSTAAGIAVAGHMLRMMRDHGIRDQMLFDLAQYRFRRGDGVSVALWGSVVETGANGRKRPQFLAESLANRVIRGDLVEVEVSGENPTHDQPEGNDGVHLRGVHEIDAYGFQEGRWHGLIVFNFGLRQARRIRLEGPGLETKTQMSVSRMISSGPGETNEETEKVKVQSERMEGTELVLAPCSMAVLEWTE
jgi:SAM-dependent methyltransferase